MAKTEQTIPLSGEMRRDEFTSSSEQRQEWANRVADLEARLNGAAVYKQAGRYKEKEAQK